MPLSERFCVFLPPIDLVHRSRFFNASFFFLIFARTPFFSFPPTFYLPDIRGGPARLCNQRAFPALISLIIRFSFFSPWRNFFEFLALRFFTNIGGFIPPFFLFRFYSIGLIR